MNCPRCARLLYLGWCVAHGEHTAPPSLTPEQAALETRVARRGRRPKHSAPRWTEQEREAHVAAAKAEQAALDRFLERKKKQIDAELEAEV